MTGVQGRRNALVAFLLLGGLGLILLFGAAVFGLDGAAQDWLTAARGAWALPLAVAAFAVLAFLGVPQFALIAAAVAVFGPWRGLAYSWAGTMTSALLGFWLGRGFGARFFSSGQTGVLARMVTLIERNGFIASLCVRLAPFGPFVLINVAAGLTAMRLSAFAAGTAIGIIPKIALTAFAGAGVLRAMRGGGGLSWALLAVSLAVWFAAGLAARRWLGRQPRV